MYLLKLCVGGDHISPRRWCYIKVQLRTWSFHCCSEAIHGINDMKAGYLREQYSNHPISPFSGRMNLGLKFTEIKWCMSHPPFPPLLKGTWSNIKEPGKEIKKMDIADYKLIPPKGLLLDWWGRGLLKITRKIRAEWIWLPSQILLVAAEILLDASASSMWFSETKVKDTTLFGVVSSKGGSLSARVLLRCRGHMGNLSLFQFISLFYVFIIQLHLWEGKKYIPLQIWWTNTIHSHAGAGFVLFPELISDHQRGCWLEQGTGL